MNSVFDASELEYKNGRVFTLRSKICVLQKCKKDNKKGFINHLMFGLLTDQSGKGANPHRWNDQIPICLNHFLQSEQDDYLRLGFFPQDFMGDHFHKYGKSNIYYATSFSFQSFLQKYCALAPPSTPPLPLAALNVIEELPVSETLENVEEPHSSPPVLDAMDELPEVDPPHCDDTAVEMDQQNGKRKMMTVEVEKSKKGRKRAKSELKENVAQFFGKTNFLAFLKEQVENFRFSMPP